MSSKLYAAKNCIVIQKPYLIQSLYFGLLWLLSVSFLTFFIFTRFDCFQLFSDCFQNPIMLSDPKISYPLFFDALRLSVFFIGSLYFLFKTFQYLYIWINSRSINAFVGVPGPIENFDVTLNDLFQESRISKPSANRPIKKGILTNLIFGNWTEWLSPKYWPILYFFMSFSNKVFYIFLPLLLLSLLFWSNRIALEFVGGNPRLVEQIGLDNPVISKIMNHINKFSIDGNSLTFNFLFYITPLVVLSLLILSTRSVFVNIFTKNFKPHLGTSGDPSNFYSLLKLELDAFKVKEFLNRIYKDIPPNIGSFTKDQRKEFSSQIIIETQPLPYSRNSPHFHLPYVCLFFSFIFCLFFFISFSFSPSFFLIPDSFSVFWESCFIILFPWFSLKCYHFFISFMYNTIFLSDLIYIKINGTLVGSKISFDAGKNGGFSSGGLSITSTSYIDIWYSKILTESIYLYNHPNSIKLSDILASSRYIINTISSPDLDDKISCLVNNLVNFKDTSINLPGVNTSDENAMRMAHANAYTALMAQGDFSKAGQLRNLLENQQKLLLDEGKKL